MKVLVVDNYDSFVFNLVQYIAELGAQTAVVRNDDVTSDLLGAQQLIAQHAPDGVLISPGPGTPSEAGVSKAMVTACSMAGLPLFGVCLGHQAIGEVFGGDVVNAAELLHGKTSQVEHDGQGVLRGLPSPFTATRYHSLVVDAATMPDNLEVTGTTGSGAVMALRHKNLPIDGVQFHPESVLTEHGYQIVANWLESIGQPGAVEASDALDVALGEVRDEAKFSLA
ncbi:aminodeoxychorismate/anthranilate synthase component II [Antricoccus suffuscus]|nr:aminodeoxychorismate/anthranilate synthase component II [Antricoccus suffuscus]